MNEDEDITEIEDEAPEVIDTPDGGAIVVIEREEEPAESAFYANLAENAPASELAELASSLLELIVRDREARKPRDEQYAEGLKRTGLGDEAPGGADFEGASKVVHPMMVEASMDFSSRIMEAIFPASGPVKDRIDGELSAEKLQRAERKTRLLNWQMTVQCPDFRAEIEQLMTQVPMGGAQYLKLRWNKERNRPEPLAVFIDEMLLPYAATNFYTAQRKTHVQYLTAAEYDQRVRSGMYRDVDALPGAETDLSSSAAASDKIEGREQSSYNEDGLRTVYEVHALTDIGFDDKTDGPAPYIVTVDESTRTVMSVYRNWQEDDQYRSERLHFVEWPFVPWRGAYPIGLPHMIGGLAAAATGALRALLDSAHINNAASMVHLEGKHSGQDVRPRPGENLPIKGTPAADDVRKLAMQLQFPPPSPVLFNLLGFLTETGHGVVRTALDNIAEGNANAPVGTTLANIEQGLTVYKAIHQRQHHAMARMLSILHRLNAENLDDDELVREAGEALATRADFDGPLDIVPVSDPTIFSEAQRFAQVQALAQRADQHPDRYDGRKVEERILETLRIADASELLATERKPRERNAISENMAAALGQPVTAFPEQDHIAHLETHLAFLVSPNFGMSPLIAPAFIPVILGHIREHLVHWYAFAVFEVASEAAGQDISEIQRVIKDDHKVRRQLDRLLNQAGAMVLEQGQQKFRNLPPIIQQAQQVLEQYQPKPEQNPIVAIETAKTQQREADSQRRHEIDKGKLAQAAREMQQSMAELQVREAGQDRRNREDNMTDIAIAGVRRG